jgi:hypothetical protein
MRRCIFVKGSRLPLLYVQVNSDNYKKGHSKYLQI